MENRSRILQGAQEALAIASGEMPQDGYAVHIPESSPPEEAFGPSTPASALRGYRHREALTQAQLAKLAGVSKQNISDMENGRRAIGKDVAQRLGKALNVPWKRFL